jgi:hypothetical protein
MTIQNIRVDPTTRNRIFNPLSASGQWFCSTFSKRSIGEIDLSYPVIVEMTQELKDLQSVTMYSEYGDALEWKYMVPYVLVMSVQGVYTMINTYGMCSHNVLQKIKDASVQVIFDIDGIYEHCGKVFLGAEWKHIKQNIATMNTKAHVRFHKFKHNAHQQHALHKFCNATGATFEVLEDPLFGGDTFSVISEEGKWLYDIHKASSPHATLQKTMIGYHTIKTKTSKVSGLPIDQLTSIAVPPTATRLETDDIINVTIKGHVIKGSGIAQVFSHALCDDWAVNAIDTEEEYNVSALYELSLFAGKDLSTISIYESNINDILQVI